MGKYVDLQPGQLTETRAVRVEKVCTESVGSDGSKHVTRNMSPGLAANSASGFELPKLAVGNSLAATLVARPESELPLGVTKTSFGRYRLVTIVPAVSESKSMETALAASGAIRGQVY